MDPLKRFHNENWHTPEGKLIREFVFGINDGLVTTVGFIAGVTGALINLKIVLMSGSAEIIAGTVSMFFGAYLASKSQNEFYQKEINREMREIKENPRHEIEEIYEIYQDKGFTEAEIDPIVKKLMSDKKMLLDFMVQDELGISRDYYENPLKIASYTGLSFLAGGIPPLLPFFTSHDSITAVAASIVLSIIVLVVTGLAKAKVTKTSRFKSALEMVLIGGTAAAAGFICGRLIALM
ncbi:MAG: VIT1/CCC1 transporter family protein [Deltaproteobacteria bacterium]|nr:VIT1/CCC1 transporter family protein [Deltaproteobacteria bacterium]